ncbi:hypothetical protein [Microbispora bryophytorum]
MLVDEPYLAIEEHAQAEHLLKLEGIREQLAYRLPGSLATLNAMGWL